MKISASFLSIKEDIKNNIMKLDSSSIDYLHLDIMDSVFVENKTNGINEIKKLLNGTKKPYDVHLMVADVFKYIDDFKTLKPEFITFHVEAHNNPKEVIEYIKKQGIKVGISIKPKTNIKDIVSYLDQIDLVLIMSVEPGYGGQSFIKETANKISEIKKLNKNLIVSIDGGINDETIKYAKDADIVVIGSYITNHDDYQGQIEKIRREYEKSN